MRANLGTLLRCELMNDEGIDAPTSSSNHTQESPTLFLEFVGDDRAAAEADWRRMRDLAASTAPSTIDSRPRARRSTSSGTRVEVLPRAMRYRGIVDGSKSKERVCGRRVCRRRGWPSACPRPRRRSNAPGSVRHVRAHLRREFSLSHPVQARGGAAADETQRRGDSRAIDMGGAASGEHGVGIGKMKHVVWEHGPFHVDAQRRIKRALDRDAS